MLFEVVRTSSRNGNNGLPHPKPCESAFRHSAPVHDPESNEVKVKEAWMVQIKTVDELLEFLRFHGVNQDQWRELVVSYEQDEAIPRIEIYDDFRE